MSRRDRGARLVATVRHDYSSTSVDASSWLELLASAAEDISEIEVWDASSTDKLLGKGQAGSEANYARWSAGKMERQGVSISKGDRVALKAPAGAVSSGILIINFWGG